MLGLLEEEFSGMCSFISSSRFIVSRYGDGILLLKYNRSLQFDGIVFKLITIVHKVSLSSHETH